MIAGRLRAHADRREMAIDAGDRFGCRSSVRSSADLGRRSTSAAAHQFAGTTASRAELSPPASTSASSSSRLPLMLGFDASRPLGCASRRCLRANKRSRIDSDSIAFSVSARRSRTRVIRRSSFGGESTEAPDVTGCRLGGRPVVRVGSSPWLSISCDASRDEESSGPPKAVETVRCAPARPGSSLGVDIASPAGDALEGRRSTGHGERLGPPGDEPVVHAIDESSAVPELTLRGSRVLTFTVRRRCAIVESVRPSTSVREALM